MGLMRLFFFSLFSLISTSASFAATRACTVALTRAPTTTVERHHFALTYPNAVAIEAGLDRLPDVISSVKEKRSLLFRAKRSAPVVLNSRESFFMLLPIARNIERAASEIQTLQSTLTVKTATVDPRALIMALTTLQNHLRALQLKPTYQDAVLVALESSILQKYVSGARLYLTAPQSSDFTMTAPLISADFDRAARDIEFGLPEFKKKGMILFPYDEELSIFDLNYLVGTGLAPGGLVTDFLRADNEDYNPHSFFKHDFSHGIYTTPGRMTLEQRARWLSLLDRVDRLPRRQTLITHVVLFYLSHEQFRVTPEKILNPAYISERLDENDLERVLSRILAEGAFGVKELAAHPPSLRELKDAAASLPQLLL